MPAQQIAGQRDKVATRVAVLNLARGGDKVGGNEGAAEQRLQEFFHGGFGLDYAQGMNDLAFFQWFLRCAIFGWRHVAFKRQLFFGVIFDGKCGDAGATGFVCAQIGENFLRGFRLLGEDKLQVMAERIFDRHDIGIRHADAVGKRTHHRARTAQRRHRACGKTFARTFKLLQHVEARTFFRLLLQKLIVFGGQLLQLRLQFAQPILPLFNRAAFGLCVQFFDFNACCEFLQVRFEPRAFLLKLDFFRGKFFKPDDIALLLQIERGDFVADARQILRGGECGGLRFAQ